MLTAVRCESIVQGAIKQDLLDRVFYLILSVDKHQYLYYNQLSIVKSKLACGGIMQFLITTVLQQYREDPTLEGEQAVYENSHVFSGIFGKGEQTTFNDFVRQAIEELRKPLDRLLGSDEDLRKVSRQIRIASVDVCPVTIVPTKL